MIKTLFIAAAVTCTSQFARADLIIGEDFEAYSAGRISTVSSSAWSSTSQVNVVIDADRAAGGSHFAEIATTGAIRHAQRNFTGIPTSGSVWVDFHVYNQFTQGSLAGTGSNPSIRIGDGSDYLIGITFRPRTSSIEVLSFKNSTSTFTDTGVSYAEQKWWNVTFEINLTDSLVNVYIDRSLVASGIAIDSFSSSVAQLDFRAEIMSSGDAFRLDEIGFYTASPIPEPGAAAMMGGGALAGLVWLRSRRSVKGQQAAQAAATSTTLRQR